MSEKGFYYNIFFHPDLANLLCEFFLQMSYEERSKRPDLVEEMVGIAKQEWLKDRALCEEIHLKAKDYMKQLLAVFEKEGEYDQEDARWIKAVFYSLNPDVYRI